MKSLRSLIWLTGIFIVVAFIAGTFFIYGMDPNDYKPQISRLAKENQINLVIDGDLSWSFFPTLAVTTSDVSISGKDVPNITFDEASFSLDWLAILGKTLRLKAIKVVNANIVITETKAQDNSPDFSQSETKEKLNNPDPSSIPFELDIASLNIKRSKLTIMDTDQKSIEFDDVNLTGKNINLDDDILSAVVDFSGVLKVEGIPSLPAQVNLEAKYDTNKHYMELKTFKSDIGLTQLQGNLVVDSLFNAPTAEGSISVINNNLVKLPFEGIPEELKKLSIQMSFSVSETSITMSNIVSILNDFTLTGDASLTLEDQRELNIKLTGSDLIFPTGASKNDEAQIKNTKNDETYQNQTVFLAPIFAPFSHLEGGKGHIEINLGSLNYDQILVKNIHFNLFSNKEIIQIADLSGEIFNGAFKFSSRINTDDSSIRFTGNTSNLDIKKILMFLSDSSEMDGILSVDFNGVSQGITQDEVLDNIVGTGNITAKNLKLNKLNFEKSYCDMAAIIEKRSFSQYVWPNYTKVNNLESEFSIEEQIITVPNFTSGIGNLSIEGDGKVNLNDQSYNFLIKANLDGDKTSENGCPIKSKSIRNINLPLRCEGSFEGDGRVLCLPDKKFMNQILKRKIKDKLFNGLLNSEPSGSEINQSAKNDEIKPADIKEQVIDTLLKGIFK